MKLKTKKNISEKYRQNKKKKDKDNKNYKRDTEQ